MLMRMNQNITTIQDYIESYPKKTQQILKKIHAIIKKAAPHADERISYGIPTFTQGTNLVHFGAYPAHVSLYPSAQTIEKHQDVLQNYKTSKGTIQFQLNEPIPYDLIELIVASRISDALGKETPATKPNTKPQ